MKLLEILPNLESFTRIKRKEWGFCLVKPGNIDCPFIKLNLYSLEIKYFTLSYEDLLADDWQIVK